jgi:hypothetical protein
MPNNTVSHLRRHGSSAALLGNPEILHLKVSIIYALPALEILLFNAERVGQDHHNRTRQDVD